jgi:uncharacterized protein YrzB (UPF0473 family)
MDTKDIVIDKNGREYDWKVLLPIGFDVDNNGKSYIIFIGTGEKIYDVDKDMSNVLYQLQMKMQKSIEIYE